MPIKRPILSLSGVTKRERHLVTSEVSNVISAQGGWIGDHSLFSNIAIAVRFFVPRRELDGLQRGIAEAGIRLDDASLACLRQALQGAQDGGDEIAVSINITFIHDEPDLRRTVPAIPG